MTERRRQEEMAILKKLIMSDVHCRMTQLRCCRVFPEDENTDELVVKVYKQVLKEVSKQKGL